MSDTCTKRNTLLREAYDVTAGLGAAAGRWSADAPGYTAGRLESWKGVSCQEHCNPQAHCADLKARKVEGGGLNCARLDHVINGEHSTQFRIPDSQDVLRGANDGRCISAALFPASQAPAGGSVGSMTQGNGRVRAQRKVHPSHAVACLALEPSPLSRVWQSALTRKQRMGESDVARA